MVHGIDPLYVHGDRKNHWQCGGDIEFTGKEIDYGPYSVPEIKCLKCGWTGDSSDAHDFLLERAEYERRQALGWSGYEKVIRMA